MSGRQWPSPGLPALRYRDDYQNGDGDTIHGTAADFLSLPGKAAWESDTGHRFVLSVQQVTDDSDRPFRANTGNLTDRLGDPLMRRYDLTSRNVVLSYEATQANGIWQPNALIAWSESIADVPEPWSSEGSAHGWNGKVENMFVLGEIGTVTAGLDFYSEWSDYTDPWTPKVTEKADNCGTYAQARLQPLPALRLLFGLRGD